MRSPSHVKDLCLAMRDGAGEETPITVKCRIGVDDDDSYEQLAAFVDEVRGALGVALAWRLWQPTRDTKRTWGRCVIVQRHKDGVV